MRVELFSLSAVLVWYWYRTGYKCIGSFERGSCVCIRGYLTRVPVPVYDTVLGGPGA